MEYIVSISAITFSVGFIVGFFIGRLKRRQYQKAGNNATQIQIFNEE